MKPFLPPLFCRGVLAVVVATLVGSSEGSGQVPAPAPSPTPAPSLGRPSPLRWRADCKVTKTGAGSARRGVEAVLAGDLRDGNTTVLPKGTAVYAEPPAGSAAATLFGGAVSKWTLLRPPAAMSTDSTVATAALTASAGFTGKTPAALKAGQGFELVVSGFSVDVAMKPTPAPAPTAAGPSPSPGAPAPPVFTPPPAQKSPKLP